MTGIISKLNERADTLQEMSKAGLLNEREQEFLIELGIINSKK
jgi:hypothetical protein